MSSPYHRKRNDSTAQTTKLHGTAQLSDLMNGKGKILITAIVLLIFALLGLYSIFSTPNKRSLLENDEESEYLYAVVVDAGSTGSRVHVYRYKNPLKHNKNAENKLIEIDYGNETYKKFYPGLSSFEDKSLDTKAMGEYLEPLLDFARQHVPFQYRPITPYFVLATAGLRKVRKKSKETSENIINTCYGYLEKSEFLNDKSFVKIIEGKDEGLWGWITANYLNGEIPNAVNSGQPSKAQTKGVLEMGGESLQITFMPHINDLSSSKLSKLLSDNKSDSLSYVSIGGIDFLIFTHSYMGVGMQAAQSAFDNLLIKEGERSESVCYIEGDTRERLSGQRVTWQGKGNFDKCYSKLTDLIKTNECENSDKSNELSKIISSIQMELKCSPNGVLMPQFDKKFKEFYYIENFYYTANVLNIQDKSGKHGEFYQSLQTSGTEYCSLNKKDAIIKYPDASEDEISKTCFCSAWLKVIIDKGFDLSDFNNYKVIRDINNIGIDWALGFLVQTSNDLLKRIELKQKLNNNNNINDSNNGNTIINSQNKLFMVTVVIAILALCYVCYAHYYNKTRHGQPNPIQRWVFKLTRGNAKSHVSYARLSQFPV